MTTETQITFQKMPASIIVRFSAEPATVTRLANGIARLSRSLGASNVNISVALAVKGDFEDGDASTDHPYGSETS